MRMKRSGRASIVIVIAIALVAAVIVLFLMAGDSASGVAARFLTALQKGDTKTLAELSYMEGLSPDQVQKKWDETYAVTKYWQFNWRVTDTKEQDSDNASVNLMWTKDMGSPSAYEDKAELPMLKKDGKWKIDVRAISREMYPDLPR